NVYLLNTIDGGTTDSNGYFDFTTTESGQQTLVASDVSYKDMGTPIYLTRDTTGIILRMLQGQVHDLEAVTITAGAYEAGSDKAKTVLKPLDIITTAGANADVVRAIQTLPGTQPTGTENGLFIRGGDASEAAIVVDEIVVQNAFLNSAPGVATRSRFGAFNFQGVSFSSGGYSARYSQALSGILDLNSTDISERSTVNFGANVAGLSLSGTHRWKNASLDGGANYSNLEPFYKLATTNYKFFDIPVGGGGNARFVYTPRKNAILKVNVSSTYNHSGIGAYKVALPDTIKFVTTDNYYFGTASYKEMFKNKYVLYVAGSVSRDETTNNINDYFKTRQVETRNQFRLEGRDFVTSRLSVLAGTEIQNFGIDRELYNPRSFQETLIAGYAEAEYLPINKIAFKPGVRYEHSALLNVSKVSPRFSLAYRTGLHSQASFATGLFYQDAANQYLLGGLRPGMQNAVHYIVNWQYQADERTLRLEGYYKGYNDLVRELNRYYNPSRNRIIDSSYITVNNSGYGYAQGAELFFRDKKTFKNVDYWVSYSYVDTRRLYENYVATATPTYISNHNLNLVGKYFVTKWNTNFSLTYSYASGRPYFNPEKPLDETHFLQDRTPDYNNLAISVAWLHSFGKWFTVFYLSADNVLDTRNVFGYRYKYDNNNVVIPGSRTEITPALYRTVVVGFFASLTKVSKDEL
ncbi:MAG: hypothetical protein EBZ77_11210, partial [Chitinophagia bacterium]|nr:hypothetical protein [Chitinophagia bacterium]